MSEPGDEDYDHAREAYYKDNANEISYLFGCKVGRAITYAVTAIATHLPDVTYDGCIIEDLHEALTQFVLTNNSLLEQYIDLQAFDDGVSYTCLAYKQLKGSEGAA